MSRCFGESSEPWVQETTVPRWPLPESMPHPQYRGLGNAVTWIPPFSVSLVGNRWALTPAVGQTYPKSPPG